MDFGSLVCWATNSIGRQTQPCVFHLTPAGRPDPVTNCTVTKQSYSTMRVMCKPGFDGGLKQVRPKSNRKQCETNLCIAFLCLACAHYDYFWCVVLQYCVLLDFRDSSWAFERLASAEATEGEVWWLTWPVPGACPGSMWRVSGRTPVTWCRWRQSTPRGRLTRLWSELTPGSRTDCVNWLRPARVPWLLTWQTHTVERDSSTPSGF